MLRAAEYVVQCSRVMTSEVSELDRCTRVEELNRMAERDTGEHETGRDVEFPRLPIDVIRFNKS